MLVLMFIILVVLLLFNYLDIESNIIVHKCIIILIIHNLITKEYFTSTVDEQIAILIIKLFN